MFEVLIGLSYLFRLFEFGICLLQLEMLTLPIPCISESCIEIKIKSSFYCPTSLSWLKRFYEAL